MTYVVLPLPSNHIISYLTVMSKNGVGVLTHLTYDKYVSEGTSAETAKQWDLFATLRHETPRTPCTFFLFISPLAESGTVEVEVTYGVAAITHASEIPPNSLRWKVKNIAE